MRDSNNVVEIRVDEILCRKGYLFEAYVVQTVKLGVGGEYVGAYF